MRRKSGQLSPVWGLIAFGRCPTGASGELFDDLHARWSASGYSADNRCTIDASEWMKLRGGGYVTVDQGDDRGPACQAEKGRR